MNTPEYLDDADAMLSIRLETSHTPSPDDARKLAVTAAGLSAVGGALAASVVVNGARDEEVVDVESVSFDSDTDMVMVDGEKMPGFNPDILEPVSQTEIEPYDDLDLFVNADD